jgi:opacity protein-like surface antigen
MKRIPIALALLLATASPASAADEPQGSDAAADKDRTRYDFAIRAVGGYFDGMGVRTDSGGLAVVELDLTPKLRLGSWTVDVPLRLDHRQTFGADLNETVMGAELAAMHKAGKTMRYGPIGGVTYTLRTGWPDLYQRNDATGALAKTDRYTHLDGFLGWQHWYRLGEGHNLRWKVRFLQQAYRHDPGFDETDPSPTHLVPRDNRQLRFDSSYRATHDVVSYGVKLDAFYRWDQVAVAREARTGAATTDLQHTWGVEPALTLDFHLAPLELSLDYGLLKQVDAVTGYYSFTSHHPIARAELALGKQLSLHARAEAWLVTYGPDSKARTEDGKRLSSTKYALKGGARYALTKDLAAVADVEWATRDTNYPDYTAPGPVIAWDYTNTMVTAGVEWKP